MAFLIHVCIQCNKGFVCDPIGSDYVCFCLSENIHLQNELPSTMFFCSGVCYRTFTEKLCFTELTAEPHVFDRMNEFLKQKEDHKDNQEDKKLDMIKPFVFKTKKYKVINK